MPPATSFEHAALPSVIPDDEWRAAIIRARTIDSQTGEPWPFYLDTEGAQRYFERVYGLKVAKQTLAHQRARGVGIRWRYFGQRPVAELTELDRHAREALCDRSPLAHKGKRGRKPRAAVPTAE